MNLLSHSQSNQSHYFLKMSGEWMILILYIPFFLEKKWTNIASELNLKDDSYALELGVSFLPEDVFCYHIPLYIYASLHNTKEFWVFESIFIQHYLCPEYRTCEDFFSFIFKFSDIQLSVIARFMNYEAKILGFDYASKACHVFWDLYL